jgi:hypothetical protein
MRACGDFGLFMIEYLREGGPRIPYAWDVEGGKVGDIASAERFP